MSIIYQPIGVVHSPHQTPHGSPIQPRSARGIRGTISIEQEYAPGLVDLEGFSHVVLLVHFHRAGEPRLTVTPFLDNRPHGVFATRAPLRPNPIGLSVVRLIRRADTVLHVEDLDLLDGTPVLDIKPYVPDFDSTGEIRLGWLEHARDRIHRTKADGRFDQA